MEKAKTKSDKEQVSLYDSTLRDGVQMSGIDFSRQDKYNIIKNLIEELSIPHIELYPFSNPKDRELIRYIKEKKPGFMKFLVAFGSTRKVKNTCVNDKNIQGFLDSELKTCTIVGKSNDFHLQFIKATPEENLQMIEDSVGYLKEYQKTVFFDAEHFFDGYKANKDYALNTLKTAERTGAERVILCDTNGGTLPHEIYNITKEVLDKIKIPLGIHTHNDCGLADANSIAAVQACCDHVSKRAIQVQGTINGFGERAGNANLITLIPVLALKMNHNIIPKEKLTNLTSISNLIYEISNKVPPLNAPFVGYNAFTHKGGMHIASIAKNLSSYEQIDPDLIGNKRRVIISEMSGKSAILHKCKKFGIDIKKDDPLLGDILKLLKQKESHGYSYDGAEASFEILIRGMLNDPIQAAAFYRTHYFEVDYFRVITDVRNVFNDNLEIFTDANIRTLVKDVENGNESEYHTAAAGVGPVNALDIALRKALVHFYPVLKDIDLIDYKVRISNAIESEQGTASRVRVLVESRDEDGEVWGTIGSHVNIIVASFVALLDSYVFKLLKEKIEPYKKN